MAQDHFSKFRSAELADLTRQLLISPPKQRMQQTLRTERLHDAIDPTANYPLEYVIYRVTRYRPERDSQILLVGEALLPDLRWIIDVLSRSVDLPDDEADPVEPIDALAVRLNVSTKTIGRWRAQGLRWRWIKSQRGGRQRLGLTRRAVDHFLKDHPDQVRRAGRFTHIDDKTRDDLITQARDIATTRRWSMFKTARHLARQTDRAIETVRKIIQQHDRDHPNDPIFPGHTRPLTDRQKRVIARAHRMGMSATDLAARFQRTRHTIYRAVHEQRAAALRELPIHFVESSTYTRDDADEVLLRRESDLAQLDLSTFAIPGDTELDALPQPVRRVYRQPRLPANLQRAALVRMNYLRFRAAALRDRLDAYTPRATELDLIERSLEEAQQIEHRLAQSAMPIVLSITRHQLIDQTDQSTNRLLELLKIGNDVAQQAMYEFDAAKAQTFEAYLNWRLRTRYATETNDPDAVQASIPRAHRRKPPDTLIQQVLDQARVMGVGGSAES